MTQRTIKIEALARVEGEGALRVQIHDDKIEHVELNIFEPPRFFEALLRGRDFREAPDITARICGICPVAYQMSAAHAMERAYSIEVSKPLRDLRRLLYCGEWIESHALHIHMLHAPDFLGYESAIHMAKDHPDIVQRGLSIKKSGNAIVSTLGGREIHPVNIRVGGFYRFPKRHELESLRNSLAVAHGAARETLAWTASLQFPNYERDYEFVALRNDAEYPMNEGRIVSSGGIDIAVDDYENIFEEVQVPHSTALHSRIKKRGAYLTGPLARYALNSDHLPESVCRAARDAGLGPVCRNPFKSIVVRAVEVLFAFEEALRLIDNYQEPESTTVTLPAGVAMGCWATEAPRGLLYHRYEIAQDRTITTARIVPPTSQNQLCIEEDLHGALSANIALDDKTLQFLCERIIRNYDPCISCATHFLKLDLDRGSSRS